MISIIINAILCVAMVVASFTIDKSTNSRNNNTSLVNLALFLGVTFFTMTLTHVFCIYGARQLATMAGRLSFMFMGWFSVQCSIYLLIFPDYKKARSMTVIQVALDALAFYILFVLPNGMNSVSIAYNGSFKIASGLMFTNSVGRVIPLTWITFYNLIYRVVIPAFTCLAVLVRVENTHYKVRRQNMILNIFGVVGSWGIFAYVTLVASTQPLILTFTVAGFIPIIVMSVVSARKDEIWSASFITKGIIRFSLGYFLPAICAGAAFVALWPVSKFNVYLFEIIFVLATIIIITLLIFFKNRFTNKDLLRDNRYADDFEKEITSIDFEESSELITAQIFRIFSKYVETSSMKILIDDGEGKLSEVYSSLKTEEEKESDSYVGTSVSIEGPAFDALLNMHRLIVFREFVLTSPALAGVRDVLIRMMDDNKADAFILLTEGRHVIGIFFLGKKLSENVYSEYDYRIFTKLYSNFFVVGYYVKNIMNEAVVGTVNREIRMSGQIITSIQENMDLIKNPKVETGYLMVPAHNIGGEFVDLIRLTDTRHIFIVGSLSGKGISASMSMVILKSIIRTYLAETTDFKLLVEKVNTFVRNSLPKGVFFAGTFGLLDFSSDTLYYINCGTPALFVYTKAYNNVIEVQGEGHILGFVKEIGPYLKVKKVKLSEGDIVMCCTDGLIETRSLRGDAFGKIRIQNGLMDNVQYPAEKIAKFAYDSLAEFTSKQIDDDITILVLKYLGGKK